LVERLKTGVKEDLESLKTDLPAKAKEQVELLKKPTKTQVYTSIFRHKHDDTPRNRALGVLSKPSSSISIRQNNRDAVRYSYTWGMGGITFYLFIVLTLTGVLLMFYYHPSKVQPSATSFISNTMVPFGKLLRNMHRWAAHLMVIAVELHMFVFFSPLVQKTARVHWNVGVILLVLTLLLSFTGYLLPDDQLGFWAVTVGTNMARATPLLGHEGPFGSMFGHDAVQMTCAFRPSRRLHRGRQRASSLLHLALHRHSHHRFHFHGFSTSGAFVRMAASPPRPVVLDSEVKEAKK